LDLRDPAVSQLAITYRMPRSLWDLGVFDEASPERAIPVSERDARETAGLYADVELESYDLHLRDELVTVEVVYSAGSAQSLSALWGRNGASGLELDHAAGSVEIPIARATGPVDQEQRELITEAFRGQHFSLRVRTPGPAELNPPSTIPGAIEESGEEDLQWRADMADLLLQTEDPTVVVQWSPR
jgi:hypothetical protein